MAERSDTEPRAALRIRDTAPIVSRTENAAQLQMRPWAGPGGKPVFNFRSDERSFTDSHRVLIPAAAFYEFTAPTYATLGGSL